MGRIAIIEEVEGLRDEQDIGDNAPMKVATIQEVHEAFDSVNTLRYSQPTHLQG